MSSPLDVFKKTAARGAQGGTMGAMTGTPHGAIVGAGAGVGLGLLESLFGGGDDGEAQAQERAADEYRRLAEQQWQRQMEGLRMATGQMQGSRDMAARFAGAGRGGSSGARLSGAQWQGPPVPTTGVYSRSPGASAVATGPRPGNMSDVQYLNMMMRHG